MLKLRLISIFAAVSLLALASCRDHLTGPPNAPPTGSDTIAYYPHPLVDGKDVTGHGHDGRISTSTITTNGIDRFGMIPLTSHGPIEVANTTDLKFTSDDSYTLSAWVQLFDNSTLPLVVGLPTGAQIEASGGLIEITNSDSSNNRLTESFSAPSTRVSDSGNQPGQWHLLTLVVKAHTNLSVYIDSALLATTSDLAVMTANKGIYYSLWLGYYGILVDDILIRHSAVTPDWVGARFHEGGWYEHSDTVTTPPATDTVWTPVSGGTSDNLVIGQFVNSTASYVGGENGVILKTTDAGNTWNQEAPAPALATSNGPGSIYGLSFLSATTGFVAADQRDISETMDGGMSWISMDASNVPQSDLVRSLYFTNSLTGFVGTADAFEQPSGSICRSTDGGQTWNPIITTNGGIYDIDFSSATNNMNGVALGRFGVAYWTANGGTSWNAGSTDKPNSLISRSTFTSATTGFAVGSDLSDTNGFVLRTDDAGHTWHTVTMTNFSLNGIANNGNGTITAVGNGGVIIESTDGGATWSKSFAGSGRWFDVRYSTEHHVVLFGVNGNIDIRDK